jgi:aspartate aminotransferase
LSYLPPQSSPAAKSRYAFDGIRAQIRDLHTENIANLALRARELGDVVALWYGEGDMVTPNFIRDAAKAAFDEGLTFYIPNMRGYPPLNEALSEYQTRLHGKPVPIARSTVTPSGMQALYMALELIVDVGTNVVYVAPQWPNIHNAIHLIGGEPRPFALDFDGDWKLDLDRLFAACDARTRAIFLSTPSNPTGWTATRAEMEALLDFSRRTGVWIISDEVYNRLYFDGRAAPSIIAVADDGDRVMSVNSFSKAWAMTGWRVGWLTHPSGVADQLGAMTQYINSGTAGPLQAGAVAALTQGEPLVEEIRQRIRTGLDLAYENLRRSRASFCRPSRAAACMPSSPWRARTIHAGSAPTYSRRRMSALHPATCSAARRTPSSGCASIATPDRSRPRWNACSP